MLFEPNLKNGLQRMLCYTNIQGGGVSTHFIMKILHRQFRQKRKFFAYLVLGVLGNEKFYFIGNAWKVCVIETSCLLWSKGPPVTPILGVQTLFPSNIKNVTPFTTSHFVEKECLSGGQPSTNDQIVYLICSQQRGIHKLRWQERGSRSHKC